MNFIDALRQEDQLTENGMATNSTSLDACVDLFFNIGAMRGQDKERLIADFSKALNQNRIDALKILFWARDIRGGAGERQVFRDIIQWMAENHTEYIKRNLQYIPEFGRWDDLLVLIDTGLESDAMQLISDAIIAENGLCAKWMPRQGHIANKLRKFTGMTPKEWRKSLVGLTNVVESKMCAKQWDEIDFAKLPSLASARYQKAFGKNAFEKYSEYIKSLQKGETKINAGAVYPYDVVKSLKHGNFEIANEQWKALPNWMEDSNEMLLPLVDVSGSMETSVGNNANVTCMDVAISLGLYISEKNEGPFKNAFITFSDNPTLEVLSGSLKDRYTQMASSNWGMSTNLEAAFKLILDQATKHNLSQSDMPTKILILSDMEFNEATGGGGWRNKSGYWNPTAQQMIEQMYADAGYSMPQIVYWNIQSRNGGLPVSFDKQGTALVSGFSPAIMQALVKGEITSPTTIMSSVIHSERYEDIY